MKRLTCILFTLFFVMGVGNPTNATVFFFDDFEDPWSGDYAPGWINAAYRHGNPPIGRMMQQTTTSHGGNYGLKLIADSVPLTWMERSAGSGLNK